MTSASPELPVEQQIVAATRQIVRAVDLHSRAIMEDCGLTGPQLAALQQVERLGSASPTAIAQSIYLSQGTVTGILQRLERRGLIERERSTTDRRGVILRITDDGRRLLERAPSLLQDRFREELANLEAWERMSILATLQRVAALMGIETMDASPHLISGSMTGDGDASGASA